MEDQEDGTILGVRVVLRMCFSLAIFHTIVFLFSLPGFLSKDRQRGREWSCHIGNWSEIFHDGFWTLKILMILGLFLMSNGISNDYYNTTYLAVSRFFSVVFLNGQGLMVIIIAYKINDFMVSALELDQGICTSVILVLMTFSLIGFNGYIIVS